MSTVTRKIGAALAGSAIAASAALTGVPAATASTPSADQHSNGHPKYKIVFDYITCHENEDDQGYDEVYMKFDDHKVWGPKNMDDGDSYYFHYGWVKFKHDFTLSLWDYDYGSHDDDDDHLGDVEISMDDAGSGWQHAEFTDSDAHYELKYKIVEY